MKNRKTGRQLTDLDPQQWEGLCDGCGRCCLVKLEDEDSGEILYTNVACQYLDLTNCRCTRYTDRSFAKPDCMVLSADNRSLLAQLPTTCAYRCYESSEVELECTVKAELSVRDKVVSELYIHPEQIEEHIINWISTSD